MSSPEPDTISSRVSWMWATIAFCIALFGVYYADQAESQRFQQEIRSETLEQLSRLRADIESRLTGDLQLFTGLAVHISLHPDISTEEIDNTIRGLMQQQNLVRSIGVSKGFVIHHVYPLQGNEAAIGLDYLANDSQREPVLRAVSTRKIVLAGPVTLIQGGQALIGRLPVFTALPHGGEEAGKFWGVVSVVLDLDRLYDLTGVSGGEMPIELAVRGRDGLGQFGDVFLGDEELFSDDPVHLDLSLPGGRWRMAATPRARLLQKVDERRRLIQGMGVILVLLFTIAGYVISRQFQQQKLVIRMQDRSREQIWHSATHDRLTGIANRFLFNEELSQAIAQARRHQGSLAVLFLDLDRFKEINDAFGHGAGDRFLGLFVEKLQGQLRESELVARLGGDEFAIIAKDAESVEALSGMAQRITSLMSQPFQIENNTFHVGVSVGISVYPDDGETPDLLLQNADLAMYTAKEDIHSSYAFFDESMNREVQERKRLVDDIRRGVDSNQFRMVYQPIVDLSGPRVVGVEALVRWNHPERGPVSPGEFIPVAEMSGLIIPLGRWIMGRTAEEVMGWTGELEQLPILSINMSPIQLHHGDPVAMVDEVLARTGLPADRLDIEITESAILEDVHKATKAVMRLREKGVSVTIDDFGTGYSSLSHLRHLPVNRVKIDISFVQQIGQDRHSEAIIRAIMFLSESLNLRVTAEGVETPEQLEFLRELGCSEIQGYYFSRPQEARFIPDFSRQFAQPGQRA